MQASELKPGDRLIYDDGSVFTLEQVVYKWQASINGERCGWSQWTPTQVQEELDNGVRVARKGEDNAD
jgi:hypothetical protein